MTGTFDLLLAELSTGQALQGEACAMIQRRRHSQNLCYPAVSRLTKSTVRRERE